MKKSTPPLIILLSLIASFYLIIFSLPAALPKANSNATADSKNSLSPELLALVRQQNPSQIPPSDRPKADELMAEFEELQDDYSQRRTDNPLKDAMAENLVGVSYDDFDFTVPEGLEDAVQFWVNIFGVYDKNFLIFYHPKNVGLVYSVLNFTDLDDDSVKAQMIKEENARLNHLLSSLAIKLKDPRAPLDREEARIARFVAENSSIDIDALGSSEALTSRTGYAHRFRQSVVEASRYLPEMERIFSERGLPVELTRIPFVESSFNPGAFSTASAAGIWQFIETTGRNYLTIDDYVDERYDPILATYAAAAHLSREYKLLKSWPLTINAYNTGPGRMLDAVEKLKTRQIGPIVKHYNGAGYGFDSRNYVPEVLAAIEVYGNRTRYFGELATKDPITFIHIEMPEGTFLPELFEVAGVDAELMKKLNGAIRPSVMKGEKVLPKGYRLRVNEEGREALLFAAKDLKGSSDLVSLESQLNSKSDQKRDETPTDLEPASLNLSEPTHADAALVATDTN